VSSDTTLGHSECNGVRGRKGEHFVSSDSAFGHSELHVRIPHFPVDLCTTVTHDPMCIIR
jgi:hypothetical protein